MITYSSLISACEKAGRWELALDLFSEMHREGCKPNVVTYNSLIAACAQGAQPSAKLGPVTAWSLLVLHAPLSLHGSLLLRGSLSLHGSLALRGSVLTAQILVTGPDLVTA